MIFALLGTLTGLFILASTKALPDLKVIRRQ